jgi:hypothetical protein
LTLIVSILSGGCEDPQRRKILALEQQLDAARKESDQLTSDVEKLSARLQAQNRQIENLQALGDKRLEYLFRVETIEIGRHSGGVDLDKKPGQDAVLVYLVPRDQADNVLKAAGSVRIQLYDLAQPQEKTLLAEFTYPVEKIGKYWAGGLLANHYRFECRFPHPPEHPDVTIRAEFTDYLTGKTFSQQKLVKVTLPPETQPTTMP